MLTPQCMCAWPQPYGHCPMAVMWLTKHEQFNMSEPNSVLKGVGSLKLSAHTSEKERAPMPPASSPECPDACSPVSSAQLSGNCLDLAKLLLPQRYLLSHLRHCKQLLQALHVSS